MIKKIATVLGIVALMIAGLVSPAQASTIYYYAGGGQSFAGTLPSEMYANMAGLNPTLDTTGPNYESHTLIEISMLQGSGSTAQIAEIGLRKASGDTTMKVFTYLWRNGVACGYSMVNLCGSTYSLHECKTVGGVNNCSQTTDNWNLGSSVPSGTTMRMGIKLDTTTGDIWFLVYQSGGTVEWLGWVDAAFYTSVGVTFVTATTLQAFGEVAPGGGALGCTDMGPGTLPSAPSTGAVIGSVSAPPLANTALDMDSFTTVTDSTKYNAIPAAAGSNVRTLLIGGPGAC